MKPLTNTRNADSVSTEQLTNIRNPYSSPMSPKSPTSNPFSNQNPPLPARPALRKKKPDYYKKSWWQQIVHHFIHLTRQQKMVYASSSFLLVTGIVIGILYCLRLLPWWNLSDSGDSAGKPAKSTVLRFSTTTSYGGVAGFVNGNASVALFNSPSDCVIDADDNVYLSDSSNQAIRVISNATGLVSSLVNFTSPTLAKRGFAFTSTAVLLVSPKGLALSGTALFVADAGDHSIKLVNITSRQTSFFAGSLNGDPGFVNGPLLQASFNSPSAIAIAKKLSSLFIGMLRGCFY